MALPRCRLCHRVLKDIESVERGFGPVCWKRICNRQKKNPAAQKATGGRKNVTYYRTPKKGDEMTISIDEWIKEIGIGDSGDSDTEPEA